MRKWVLGARLRTLPAAVVPVVLGGTLVVRDDDTVLWRWPLALVVALALQIAVNYANDYSDGVRGTDTDRIGPTRLVATGLASARQVKRAAFMAFGVAGVAGAVLAFVTTPWLFSVGVASMLAGWFYTGGPRPYGYSGFGEVFVFVFFGLVATVGTTFVMVERLPAASWLLGTSTGALACALLVTNNLRDAPTDALVGKNTLAVRLGVERTRVLYAMLVAISFVSLGGAALFDYGALLGLMAVVPAVTVSRRVLGGASGRELITVLGGTGRVQLVLGVLASVGMAITGG
jgi:1,4-dihydroxy-2-naphthoate polyprenyltransferase